MEFGRNHKASTAGDEQAQRGFSRRTLLKGSLAAGVVGANIGGLATIAGAATNSITAENAKPGNPSSEWESWRSESIAGFADPYSVLPGETVTFRVDTVSTNYRVRIYRMGWYGGDGARLVATVNPSVTLPQTQPAPLTDAATGLVDCGNWAPSATWAVPANAVSGVYYASFDRLDVPNEDNFALFVVRRPGPSAIVVQTSETTWHAYNRYGGKSLYWGQDGARAYKVSYNRPLSNGEEESSFLANEFALARFLERNGYDVSYCGNIDTHLRAAAVSNGQVFISSGHDEYWSGEMRQHVEQARDTGTNLMFLTGNEVYWKIRFEPSIAPGAAPARTIVCYKETLDNAKTDPSGQWTGTWRDARFSPPSDGGRPENALTGQLFRAILPVGQTDLAIKVPAAYGGFRFWRNTTVAQLQPGQTAELAPNTLGYEFDVDADNGFRPAGLIHLSETSAAAPEVLQDNGGTYAPGVLTHQLSMYRAASGALVFGAGTVQWAYGLDSYHSTDPGSPTDQRMKQATVNLLADMGVQPAALESGLVAASAAADASPPASTITVPAPGAQAPLGAPFTISGTAVDAGGGRVAAVEVSTDNGATWHPATGRASWSYVFTPMVLGPTTIKVRAIDDSARIETTGPSVPIQVGPRALPCSIWPAAVAPQVPATNDPTPIEVGLRFRVLQDGFVTGLRFYKGPGNTGTHVGNLWTAGGQLLATVTFAAETASGWQTAPLPPVTIAAGTTYVASVYMPNGNYPADAAYFSNAFELSPLRALANGEDGANGVFRYGSSGFPTSSYGAANYWVDIVFDDDNGIAPTVVDVSPGHGLVSVATTSTVAATFSEGVQPSSVAMELRDGSGALVAGTAAYDQAGRRMVFTPDAALLPLSTYSAAVTAAVDLNGEALAAPFTWNFTTIGAPGTSPATLWDTAAAPAAVATNDTAAVELGVRFTAEADGDVRALRYYKAPGAIGVHVGHLWDAAGALLATVSFDNETASGWQQANLTVPVPMLKGAQYVASYFAPNGGYVYSPAYFNTQHRRDPLVAPAGISTAGNGVYRYGASGFPSNSYNNGNYWVDVVFGIAPDVTGPIVSNVEPAPSLIAVNPSTVIRATFNEPVDANTVSFAVSSSAGTVNGTTSYDSQTRTATFTPAVALAVGRTYTAIVEARDTSGNAMLSPYPWTFTTNNAPGVTPVTIWDSAAVPAVAATTDAAAVELGVRINVQRSGEIKGLRFYKGEANVGPHVGHLWAVDGTLLATVAFTEETASGWQQAMFATPVPVNGGSSYIASYFAPMGRYAVSAGYFAGTTAGQNPLTAPADSSGARNGQYRYGGGFPDSSYNAGNYWVDVIYDDKAGPVVTATAPSAGMLDVAVSTGVAATFDEAIQNAAATLSLLDGGGAAVAGSQSYNSATRTLSFTPAGQLAAGSNYTATVSGAIDLVGNPMAAPAVWSFRTADATTTSIWTNAATPGTASVNDPSPIELGLKWQSTVAGTVRGVRFYKGPANTGTHIGHLWTATGTLLATVEFTGESASGWQQAVFATPVAVQAATTYVVSYYTSSGNYSYSGSYFGAATTNGVLSALSNAAAGGNALYRYGTGGGFPTNSYGAANYWVDILFQPS